MTSTAPRSRWRVSIRSLHPTTAPAMSPNSQTGVSGFWGLSPCLYLKATRRYHQ